MIFFSLRSFSLYPYCIFSTIRKLEWLKHLKQKHVDEFNELIKKRKYYCRRLREAVADISEDEVI